MSFLQIEKFQLFSYQTQQCVFWFPSRGCGGGVQRGRLGHPKACCVVDIKGGWLRPSSSHTFAQICIIICNRHIISLMFPTNRPCGIPGLNSDPDPRIFLENKISGFLVPLAGACPPTNYGESCIGKLMLPLTSCQLSTHAPEALKGSFQHEIE